MHRFIEQCLWDRVLLDILGLQHKHTRAAHFHDVDNSYDK